MWEQMDKKEIKKLREIKDKIVKSNQTVKK